MRARFAALFATKSRDEWVHVYHGPSRPRGSRIYLVMGHVYPPPTVSGAPIGPPRANENIVHFPPCE